MTFTLRVDGPRWRGHVQSVRDVVRRALQAPDGTALGDVVPVAKGNGYGFGIERLAREAAALDVPALAVGTVFEVGTAARAWDGDLLVLGPFEPADTVAAGVWAGLDGPAYGDRLVRTVSSREGLLAAVAVAAGAPVRLLLEGLTSLHRFGLSGDELAALLRDDLVREAVLSGAVRVEGLALHLPMAQPVVGHPSPSVAPLHDVTTAPVVAGSARVREVVGWAQLWETLLAAADLGDALAAAPTLWVSHLDDLELAQLRAALPQTPVLLRTGTRLWLGDRGAATAQGTVLAVHRPAGARAGYRQRRVGRDDTVLVVGGGTAHGVALEAPSPAMSARQRVVSAGTGVLEAGGRALSPFLVAGRQRWFVEPPHAQVSLVRLPRGVPAPEVGGQVDCEVRMTTASFDAVLGLD